MIRRLSPSLILFFGLSQINDQVFLLSFGYFRSLSLWLFLPISIAICHYLFRFETLVPTFVYCCVAAIEPFQAFETNAIGHEYRYLIRSDRGMSIGEITRWETWETSIRDILEYSKKKKQLWDLTWALRRRFNRTKNTTPYLFQKRWQVWSRRTRLYTGSSRLWRRLIYSWFPHISKFSLLFRYVFYDALTFVFPSPFVTRSLAIWF